MKITVLGRGNAGCITALHYSYYAKINNLDIQVELIHDSKTPTLVVGQATLPQLPQFLWETIGTDLYNNQDDLRATLKSGILYEGWGKHNDKLFHGFPLGTYALHYDTKQVQDYIIKNSKGLFDVKVKDEKVIKYEDIDSDYIFDCRGWPPDKSNYEPLVNPLNSVVCSNIKKVEDTTHWTRACATPDGWAFYIPLYNQISLGYMYNSNVTTREQAEENFRSQFGVDHIRESFPFEQYICKTPIVDDRIVMQGNRLFFLEPLESTSVATYDQWNRMTWDWIVNKKYTTQQTIERIRNYTKQVQNFILYHYAFGSKFDTPFWDYAKKLADGVKDEDFDNILKYSLNEDKLSIRNLEARDNNQQYAQWKPWNIKLWYDGMTRKV